MLSDFLLLAPALVALLALLLFRRFRGLVGDKRKQRSLPDSAIVVDGSNVMYWGGDASAKTLVQVLRAVKAKGLNPIVFFDANVGYKLANCYYDEVKLAGVTGVPRKHILVADKGVVADEWILDFATKHGLRVVSNDRFRDWGVQFPLVKKKGRVMRGTYRDGNVVWAK